MSNDYNIHAATNYNSYESQDDIIFDHEWIRNTFMIGRDVTGKYSDWINKNRFHSNADLKFTSTAPGMGIPCNPDPQYTRYTDPRRPGLIKGRDPNDYANTGLPGYDTKTDGYHLGLGMGRYYSQAIDDNQQRIYVQCGEPQYLSMLYWIGKSFDIEKSILYRRGFITSALLDLINIGSKLWAIATAPWLYIGSVVLDYAVGSGQFISIKDNMYTYWTIAETILNSMFVKRTGVPFMYEGLRKGGGGRIGQELEVSKEYVKNLSSLIPGIMDPKTGRISLHAIGLRSQAVFNRLLIEEAKIDRTAERAIQGGYSFEQERYDSMFTNRTGNPAYFAANLMAIASGTVSTPRESNPPSKSESSFFSKLFSKAQEVGIDMEDDMAYTSVINPRNLTPSGSELTLDPSGLSEHNADKVEQDNANDVNNKAHFDRIGEYMTAMATQGATWAVFNVQATGAVSESFSNTAGTNPIESIWNSAAAQTRQVMQNLTSLTSIPGVGDAIGFLGDAASVVLKNVTFGLANPILALFHGSSVSLPKTWSGSSASLPRASYKIRLTSVYGNSYSQLFNMYLPLAMLMAMSFPRSTGISSYAAPFMIRMHDQGRVNIPYGMVESINITRGTSNLAFTRAGKPNAIDVDITFLDLNEIVAIDITPSGVLTKAFDAVNPDFHDTALSNYINTITGVSPYEMAYATPSLRSKLIEKELQLRATFTDPAAQGAFVANIISKIPGINMIGELAPGSGSLISSQAGL